MFKKLLASFLFTLVLFALPFLLKPVTAATRVEKIQCGSSDTFCIITVVGEAGDIGKEVTIEFYDQENNLGAKTQTCTIVRHPNGAIECDNAFRLQVDPDFRDNPRVVEGSGDPGIGGSGGGGTAVGGTAADSDLGPAVSGKNPCGPTGAQCPTALGNIDTTSASVFAQRILTIAFGIAGGLAFILMVVGAIKVLTSSGDAQKLSAGRDQIVAAIAGLLFLIFSGLILRFIGICVLQLQLTQSIC